MPRGTWRIASSEYPILASFATHATHATDATHATAATASRTHTTHQDGHHRQHSKNTKYLASCLEKCMHVAVPSSQGSRASITALSRICNRPEPQFGALSLAERRGRNPWAARNLARNPRFDQSGETQLYGSNSLNRQDCFSQTLLLPGCSSTSASPRLVLRAFKPQLSLTETFSCSLKMSDRKAVIKNADMSEEMQQVGIAAH